MRRRRGPARADRPPARPHIGQSQAANWHSSHSDADQILLPASSNPAEQSGGNARVLVMRRRAGESFLIGEAIEIEVLEVCGTRVKLGIVAPDSVLIQRRETHVGDICHYDSLFWICYRTPPAGGDDNPPPNGSAGFIFGAMYWDLYTKPVQTGGAQQYPSPTIYAGNYTQMPDPTIQAQIGADMTPAYRGLIYAV